MTRRVVRAKMQNTKYKNLIIAFTAAALLLVAGLVTAQAPQATTHTRLPLVRKDPTLTPTPTATLPPLPTLTPTATLPPTVGPTVTPTLPPPTFNECQADPNPGAAPDYPVRIVTVFKDATPEVVRLQNTSTSAVSLDGWIMCSITGNQRHDGIGGVLAPGEVRDFPYTGSGFIWNNSSRDDGALYTPDGRLASYWVDN
jgi:hypothetical protein